MIGGCSSAVDIKLLTKASLFDGMLEHCFCPVGSIEEQRVSDSGRSAIRGLKSRLE